MRWTQYFINTVREEPADAEVISQKLMMRASMIRKVAAGIYSSLPLGLRSIHKLEKIVREEMNRAGAIELTMPAIQPAELWMESGRWMQYGKELLRIKDRHDRDFVFGPTHEEVVTDIVRDAISSYRQLPTNLYQIQTKFRDEVRPRFGLMRGREFIMKDAYSFHASADSLDETYQKMHSAYTRIFERCGLDHVVVEADTGNIGGSSSHEFMVLAGSGEDLVVRCPKCNYGANVEKAEMARATPEVSEQESQPLEKVATPETTTIDAVCDFLGVRSTSLIKSLVFEWDEGAVMILVRGNREANEVKIKNHLGATWLELATPEAIEKATGGPEGFSGPVSIEGLTVLADESLRGIRNAVAGANEKDAHYKGVSIERDFSVSAFGDFVMVDEGDPCPRCETPMEKYRGIEVGHIFKLGTKYSEKMNCEFLDESGERKPMIMGCYGLGVGRTVAAAIEQSHDEDGIIWPVALAPFEVVVTPLGPDEDVHAKAGEVYAKLLEEGIEAILDDRDERPGVKFKDADLIGFPFRITIGKKGLANGEIEWSSRTDREKKMGVPDEVVQAVVEGVRNASVG